MRKIRRYFEEGTAYFVTTVTKERRPVFLDARLCRIFLVTVEYYKAFFDYRVFAYCIMPDHVHLLIQTASKYSLSLIMQMLKGSFSRKLNRLSNSTGHVWQRRYYDEVVRTNFQLLNQIDYIHANPVAAGLVDSVELYSFSSHSQYYGQPALNEIILEIDKPT